MDIVYNEIEALKDIDERLSKLPVDCQHRVLVWINAKYSGGGRPLAMSPQKSMEPNSGEFGSIKDFIAAKKTNGYYERIACLAYYLEKVGGMTEGCKTADITKANNDARMLKIPNPSQYVSDAVKSYGYLTSIGNGRKALTAKGEALVEALPDREKVKAALAEHPAKRRTAKKTKNSKEKTEK